MVTVSSAGTTFVSTKLYFLALDHIFPVAASLVPSCLRAMQEFPLYTVAHVSVRAELRDTFSKRSKFRKQRIAQGLAFRNAGPVKTMESNCICLTLSAHGIPPTLQLSRSLLRGSHDTRAVAYQVCFFMTVTVRVYLCACVLCFLPFHVRTISEQKNSKASRVLEAFVRGQGTI